MWVDLVLGALIILCGMIGLFQGIIIQVFRLGGLALVILYARAVAEPAGQWVATQFSLMPLVAYYIALIVGGLIIYAFCALAGRAVHKMLKTGGGAPHHVNRLLGGFLGLAHGVVIAFLLASILEMVPAEALDGYPTLQSNRRTSRAVPMVHSVNPLPQLRFLVYINDYKRLLNDERAQVIFQHSDDVVKLYDHPKFRKAASDTELRKLIGEKRWPEVLVHEKVLSMLFDREVRTILNRLNPRAALEEAEKTKPGEAQTLAVVPQ